MKIAITVQGQDLSAQVDPRFGRAKNILLVDSETEELENKDNSPNLNAAQGAGIQTAQNVANSRAEAVISGNMGPNAFRTLQAAGVKIYLCQTGQTAEQALEKFKAGELEEIKQANVRGHWM
jgi:predicted Fe-Mo cluster-binding NifX family protein